MSAPSVDGGGDWRESIAQSFRSGEVRSIAKVLASLEPGATSASKTMLAMRFEESIFKAASDLDDYRKTIQKRLKRLQKHYAKQQKGGGGEAGDGAASKKNEDLMREKELMFESDLRDKFGAKLLYIAAHADDAVELTRKKHGDHKADVLRQHASNAKQWAVHIGLELPENCSGRGSFVRQEKRDMEFLLKLKNYLETRVENIRSHIVKVTDPDLFIGDALVKLDDVILKEKITDVFRKVLAESDSENSEFSVDEMSQLMKRMNAPVPIPRRNQEGDRIKASVARIEKVRAAAQALYTYMGLPVSGKTSFRGSMEKCHLVVMECLRELESEYNNLVKEIDDKDDEGKRIIQLEDAWNNPMQFTELDEVGETPSMDDANEDGPHSKRRKTEEPRPGKAPMAICSRYLLTRGRNTFSTLLPALKRKRATLFRNGSAAYVKLDFGKAFEMTIYFEPLLVAIRALSTEALDETSSSASLVRGHCWPSLYQGLSDEKIAKGNGNVTNEGNDNLHLLGMVGSRATLGPIIAKKLEYASAQATYVLRRCFAETTVGKSAVAKSEFEVEILEAGALIRFLQMARSTYIPDWVDDE
ncbi:hypothetical protein ACHAWF_003411 [Thalassiosira exigua]